MTEKQLKVLGYIGDGLCNKEIARLMGITEGTVKQHVQAVYDKIGVRKRTQAVLWLNMREIKP